MSNPNFYAQVKAVLLDPTHAFSLSKNEADRIASYIYHKFRSISDKLYDLDRELTVEEFVVRFMRKYGTPDILFAANMWFSYVSKLRHDTLAPDNNRSVLYRLISTGGTEG